MFRYMETIYYLCNTKKLYMEAKSRFKVKLSNEAQEFLDGLPNKVREKIISNIRKSTFVPVSYTHLTLPTILLV